MDEIDEQLLKLIESLKELVGDNFTSGTFLGPEFCNGMACLGTPAEIAKLINAGYGGALCGVIVEGMGITNGGRVASERFPMVQLRHDHNGCVMHKNGKCLLMGSGLTPAIGAIHLLTCGTMDDLLRQAMIPGLVMEWTDRDNRDTVKFCLRSLDKLYEIIHNHTN